MTTTTATRGAASAGPARGVRFAARLAAAVVALVAGAASFEHIASVAIGAGERAWVGYSLPFAIDGLIVVGVTALIEDQRNHRHPRPIARLAVLVGVVATLAANVASAEPTATARLVALAAPVSFLLSVEVLTRTGRPLSTPDDTNPPHPRQPAATTSTRPASRRRRPSARERVVKAVREHPDATAAEIAARLKVSERTVQRYRPVNGAATAPAGGSGTDGGRGVVPLPAGVLRRGESG